MNKKIFAIILASIFLLSAIAFVSAQEISDSGNIVSNSFSVKIDWKDAGQTDAKPDSITVNLMKNGEVIGTKELKKDNNWSATFDVAEDGNFSVKQVSDLSNYSASVNISSNNEFVISYKLKDTSSSEPQGNASAENTNKIIPIIIEETDVNHTNTSDNGTDPAKNSTDNNSTENNTKNNTTVTNNTIINTTNNTTNNTNVTNSTDNNSTDNNTANSTANNDNSTGNTTKIIIKKEEKPIITTELLKVGIPIIVLLAAIFVAIIVKR